MGCLEIENQDLDLKQRCLINEDQSSETKVGG